MVFIENETQKVCEYDQEIPQSHTADREEESRDILIWHP